MQALRGDPEVSPTSGMGCGPGWRILSHLHVRHRGPGQGWSGHRMMTLGVKSGSLSSKLLGNYFLVGNCRENTQPFNLR